MRRPSVGLGASQTSMVRFAVAALGFAAASCSAYDSSRLASKQHDIASDAGFAGGHDAFVPLDAGHPNAADSGSVATATDCDNDAEFPTCTRPHAETTCASGFCFVVGCVAPFVDCDDDADNGCEARLDSPEHCGLCGAACALPNGDAACIGGQCVLARCQSGFGNCDDISGNGCETALDDITSCGDCDTTCKPKRHALPACMLGQCAVGGCVGAFGDCNLDVADGCEQPLDTLPHCRACDTACGPDHADGDCSSGDCVVAACQGVFIDCNGSVDDGCEATLTSTAHCGACGANCSLPNAVRQKCDDTLATTACAIDHQCAAGAIGCVNGAPENGCATGFGDCDLVAQNGCETDLARLSDCGACDASCVTPNTVTACVAGECEQIGCVAGYAQCTTGGPCVSVASDPLRCGDCATVCGAGTPNCAGGTCTSLVCAAGTADCDGANGNGCEASLSSAGDCGVCGNACGPLPHASASCVAGACAIGACNAGYADCDGDASNGCEVDTHTTSDCGGCGQTCTLPNAQTACPSGTCALIGCDSGRANCNGTTADGCETDLALPADCGACDVDCRDLPNVISSGCGDGQCVYVCQSGRADCDGNAANGCEVDLATASDCGACDNDCSGLPHVASGNCAEARCKNLVCDSDWADCNVDPSDGCERSLRTATDCAACNQPCAPAHGTATCFTGTCTLTACDGGWDNCNANTTDGCEASLNATTSCGSCSKTCNEGFVCDNGQCACNEDADCGGGTLKCCDGACIDAGGACFPWPCVPGTARTNNANCGGCGQACGLWCCSTP